MNIELFSYYTLIRKNIKMPLPYQQNKQHIYNWREYNKEKHFKQHCKDAKNYYAKNKEIINMKNMARNRLGKSFYSLCSIYSNLYE